MKNIKNTTANYLVHNYTHFLELPLKIVGCWDWYQKPTCTYHIFVNNIYLAFVLFTLVNLPVSLTVLLYSVWEDLMSNLDKIADGLPLLSSVAIVTYFAIHKKELYELIQFMNNNFKWHSSRGLTNMTMERSYRIAKNFAYFYTACTLFSVAMYVFLPVVAHYIRNTHHHKPYCLTIGLGSPLITIGSYALVHHAHQGRVGRLHMSFVFFILSVWMKQPLQPWMYMGVTQTPYLLILFLRQCVAQAFVGLAMGQLGVFFASTSIILCGQLDLVCCSLRNVRYTALLTCGVRHDALVSRSYLIREDEMHSYLYNTAQMIDSEYHYDVKVTNNHLNMRTQFDIYSYQYDSATVAALNDCARVYQAINTYKEMFERFVSPLLVLRVAQVTLYLCTLLYAATLKFDMVTVEYLGAVALDMFVYCYFGSQITLQADRVSTAAYQWPWMAAGGRPRRVLLNLLQAARRPLVLRAGRFLPMDLHTFVVIIKTSFSYYTLLISVNEK